MGKYSTLNLPLSPTSATSLTPLDCRSTPMDERSSLSQQQITIFYNGQVFVCDMIELQARAILLLATREMQERITSGSSKAAASSAIQTQIYGPSSGSMKRSLQRFLQKRKRSQSPSPYNL